MSERMERYPVILVPGVLGYGDDKAVSKVFPYFGMTSAPVESIVKEGGQECYTASFGLLSSIWERTCELYAQIKGGQVDYGEAFAARAGIDRFGKKYPGWIPDWDNDHKIILIAHGFGAPVARLLVDLMAGGSKEEQAAPGHMLSDLFTGGKDRAVHAVVTLAGVNDGTTLLQGFEDKVPGISKKLVQAALKTQKIKDEGAADAYLSGTAGNLLFDLGLDGMEAFNASVSANPETYYIAYTGEVTKDYADAIVPKIRQKLDEFDGGYSAKSFDKRYYNKKHWEMVLPTPSAGLLAPTATFLGLFKNYLPENPIVSFESHPNDGLVNTNTSLAPSTEEAAAFQSADRCQPGRWYQMPIERKNHLAFTGFFRRPDQYRLEVRQMLETINQLP
ncbi:MAG: hypothetical protein IJ133_03410 [Clostridia bacterium]|nr:hypothetical protein [Clostridia bacterium]